MSANKNSIFMDKYRSDPEFRNAILQKRKLRYWQNREEKISKVKEWRSDNPDKCKKYAENARGPRQLWNAAKRRAKKFGIPFEIEVSDIVFPEYCPALGIKLFHGNGKMHDASPTLDRVIPELGYVKGNIAVISLKANVIKSNASVSEIKKVVCWLENFFSASPEMLTP